MNVPPDDFALKVLNLCRQYLRAPDGVATDSDTGAVVATFTPPLSAAEQTSFADIQAMAKSSIGLTLTEYQTIKPFLPTMRTFQQMSQSDFIALGQNARDRMLFDTLSAVIRVERVLLRDS